MYLLVNFMIRLSMLQGA